MTGKSQADIIREFKLIKVNKMVVTRIISRYNSTGSIAKRYGGNEGST